MSSTENFDSIYGETIDRAIETGFLFSYSLNYYENHTREEILTQGYSEDVVECAERVLAHFGTSVGAKESKCPEELWSIHPCADCHTLVDSRKFSDGMLSYRVELCEQCFNNREAKKICFYCNSKYDDPAIENDSQGRCRQRYASREKKRRKKVTPWERGLIYFTPHQTRRLQTKRKIRLRRRYICSWCALIKHSDKDFIRKRIEDYDSEKRQDAAKLNIKSDNFEQYKKGKKGEVAGKNWKDYHIEFDYYLHATFKEPITIEEVKAAIPLSGFIIHPKDRRKLFKIYRIRIFFKHSLAFFQLSYGSRTASPTVDLMNIGSIEGKEKQAEKNKEFNNVKKGSKLFYKIKGPGRPEKWTKSEILGAIRFAARQIKNKNFLTQPYIAEKLKDLYQLGTNFNEKRLSELLKRKKINWTELQTQLKVQHITTRQR